LTIDDLRIDVTAPISIGRGASKANRAGLGLRPSLLAATAAAGLGRRPRRASDRLPPSFGRPLASLQPGPREAGASACTPGLADGQGFD